jgi:hypothetical protein
MNLRLGQPEGPCLRYIVPGDVVPVAGLDDSEEEPGRIEQLLRLSGLIDLNCVITVSDEIIQATSSPYH